MFKVNNKDTRTTPFLVSLLLTLNIFHTLFPCSSATIVNFGQVNGDWVIITAKPGC